MKATTASRPNATTITMVNMPICVPRMFISPAFVPRASDDAMMTVTVGPGTMASSRQAAE